jgi:hypothetical protein
LEKVYQGTKTVCFEPSPANKGRFDDPGRRERSLMRVCAGMFHRAFSVLNLYKEIDGFR